MKNHSITPVVYLLLFIFCAMLPLSLDVSFAQPYDGFITGLPDYSKVQDEQNPPVTVVIDSQGYIVPESWQGNKIDTPLLTAPPLVQVPPKLVKNGGKIYLLPEACNALTAMAEKAEQDNIALIIDSGYRSAWYQKKIFKRLMEKGKTFDEIVRYVAPPGYSEHMLGLAVDFFPSDWRFADSLAYQWLKQHAGTFGFTESYPESRPDNKPWEPSHWRYNSQATSLPTQEQGGH